MRAGKTMTKTNVRGATTPNDEDAVDSESLKLSGFYAILVFTGGYA